MVTSFKVLSIKMIDHKTVPDKEGFSVYGGISVTISQSTEETLKFNRTH